MFIFFTILQWSQKIDHCENKGYMYSILNTVAVMLQPTPQIPHRIKKTNSELACILFESETKDINFKRTKTNSKGHNDGMEILGIKCCMFYKKYKSRNKIVYLSCHISDFLRTWNNIEYSMKLSHNHN